MRNELGRIIKLVIASIGPDLRMLRIVNEKLLVKINRLEDLIMGTKSALQEMADQIGQLRTQISGNIENIAKDIEGLTAQLAGAATPEDVQNILKPQVDALRALAESAQKTADIVPETPAEPVPGEL
jgi:DNA anti-recombination protein RmuC